MDDQWKYIQLATAAAIGFAMMIRVVVVDIDSRYMYVLMGVILLYWYRLRGDEW